MLLPFEPISLDHHLVAFSKLIVGLGPVFEKSSIELLCSIDQGDPQPHLLHIQIPNSKQQSLAVLQNALNLSK